VSRRQRCRSEEYRARRFIRRHPDLVASALEVASRSALASVVAPFIGQAAAERLIDEHLAMPAPAEELRRPEMFRNVTGVYLESAGLVLLASPSPCPFTNLEYRGPAGERFPLTGLVVEHGQTIADALEADLVKRGEGWTIWFVTPGYAG
jgi:hypothetical protein